MLDRDRATMNGENYDYIFIFLNKESKQETIVLKDQSMLDYHVKLAKYQKQTYTAYTWNIEHGCYVQSSCYPTCPMPCLK